MVMHVHSVVDQSSEGFIRHGKRPIASCLAGLTVQAMTPDRETRVQDVCSTF